MKTVQIKLQYQPHLCEIGQLLPIKFAFCNDIGNDVFEAQMPLVQCRDFLLDITYSNHHPDILPKSQIYGLNYDVNTNPVSFDKTRFIVRFPQESVKETFIKSLYRLHAVEKHLKLCKTKVYNVDKSTIVLVGSNFWNKLCLTVNLYTLLIKLISHELPQNTTIYNFVMEQAKFYGVKPVSAECEYIGKRTSPKFLEHVLRNLRKIVTAHKNFFVDGCSERSTLDRIHNNTGIVSYYQWRRTNPSLAYSKYLTGFEKQDISTSLLEGQL